MQLNLNLVLSLCQMWGKSRQLLVPPRSVMLCPAYNHSGNLQLKLMYNLKSTKAPLQNSSF